MTLVLTSEADGDTVVWATSNDLDALKEKAVAVENDLNHVEQGEEGAVADSAFEEKRPGYWVWELDNVDYFITDVPHV